MKITLTDNYRLPSGKPLAYVVAKLFGLQRKEIIAYVKSGRRNPINLNGWIDYWVDKILPYSMNYFASGWKMQSARLMRVEPKKSCVGSVAKDANRKKKRNDEDDELLLFLWFAHLIDPAIVSEVRTRLRRTVSGINNTTARFVNEAIANPDIDEALSLIMETFQPSRATLIGEDESVRSYHAGMTRMLEMSKYRWVKTWKTAADESVCFICRLLDGVTLPLSETFVSMPGSTPYLIDAPPAHPGPCRCRLEFVAEAWPVPSRQGAMV